MTDPIEHDRRAANVGWDLEPLLDGLDVDGLLAKAEQLADEVVAYRGRLGALSGSDWVEVMSLTARLHELVGRAGNYASLMMATDTADPARGALMAKVQQRGTALSTRLIFFDLEWTALDGAVAEEILSEPGLAFCAHHLRTVRRSRPHLLSEPEERVDTEKSQTSSSAWSRLFGELIAGVELTLSDHATAAASGGNAAGAGPLNVPLEAGLSLLSHPSRDVRRQAADAVTEGLQPGLRTRAFVFNTVLLESSIEDRLRGYPTWLSSRNLANEASDASVAALVEAVIGRYDLPQRWYRTKAAILGVERLSDFDRSASVASSEVSFGWQAARELVLDSYHSFSPTLADVARRFFDESWIDAPLRPAKRPGAFCAYTVPSHHPYLLLNWTAKRRDVLTLAHELGHGLHAYLARDQGIFHVSTPLTLAETASVFGETVTFGRLLEESTDPADRLALLAESVEGAIATVFRQTAMNRFEEAIHTHRRDVGELSLEDFGNHWATTQAAMLGSAVELTEGYRTWWSYIPHFINTPGYVYAYAYGQLLALSVYQRYVEEGAGFVPRYLELLAAGGSQSPEALASIVGCDLTDPGFWDGGLSIIEGQIDAAEDAARQAGRL
ncbi:MAG: M3 family oligoendopeptidase [Acidimicrobiales bacterium]